MVKESAGNPEGSNLYHRTQLSAIRNKIRLGQDLLAEEGLYLDALAEYKSETETETEQSSRKVAGPAKAMRNFPQEAALLKATRKKMKDGVALETSEKEYLRTGDYPKHVVPDQSQEWVGAAAKAAIRAALAQITERPASSDEHADPQVAESADAREEISVQMEVDYDAPLQSLVKQYGFGKYIPPMFEESEPVIERNNEGKMVRSFVAIPFAGGTVDDFSELLQKRNLEPATIKEMLTFFLDSKIALPTNVTLHAYGTTMPEPNSDYIWTPVLERHDFSSSGGGVETQPLMYDIGRGNLSGEKIYILAVEKR